jgi:hypothetical protein
MWTEDSEAHIARHGVTPDEVEEGLFIVTARDMDDAERKRYRRKAR